MNLHYGQGRGWGEAVEDAQEDVWWGRALEGTQWGHGAEVGAERNASGV